MAQRREGRTARDLNTLASRRGLIRLCEVLFDRRDDVADVVLGHERVGAPVDTAIHDAVGAHKLPR